MKKKIISLICTLVLLVAYCVIVYAGDETATITSQIDNRKDVDYPVWEIICTWTYDINDVGAETQAVHINGILLKVVIDIPATTSGGSTSQVLIKDNGDHTIFDSGEQAESDTVPYLFNLYEPVAGTIDIIYEPSQASGSTVEYPMVTLRGI